MWPRSGDAVGERRRTWYLLARTRKEALAVAYRQRVISALKWNVSGQFGVQAIRFVLVIILARLLSPHEFGLMAMLTVITQFLVLNSDLGFEQALIHRREITEAHRSSVFWLMILVGLVLGVALVAGASWIAKFYGVDGLTALTRLVAAVFVLRALGVVPRALVARQLDFRIVAARRCAAVALGGVCAVGLAWRGFGVTSLAVELLVTTAAESLLLLVACGWRPRFEFAGAAVRDLLGFSVYRPAARTLSYWAQHIDKLLIGRFLGSGPLGLYGRAYNLARLPVLFVSRAIVNVMFASLASIQDDHRRVRRVYLRTIGAVALATVPMCLGLSVTAEPLVIGVLGPQWRAAVPILRLLALAAAVQSITTLASSLYLSQGRADLQFRLTALQRLSTIAAIFIGLRWGVLGIATALVLVSLINALPTLYFAGRLIGLPLAAVLAETAPVLIAAAIMTAAVAAVDAWTSHGLPPLTLLSVEVLTGALVYWVALLILRARAYFDVLGLLWLPASAGDA